MKALVRNKGETITEADNIESIDWKNGHPLTSPSWCGGPYKLVQNYVPPVDEPTRYEDDVEPEQVAIEDKDEYVVIDGKKYSKTELRSLL